MHALQTPTSPVPPSDKHPGAPSFWFRVSSLSPQCKPHHSCRGPGTPPWTASPFVRASFTLVSMERRDRPDLKTTFIPNFLQTCLMSSLTPSMGSITSGDLRPSRIGDASMVSTTRPEGRDEERMKALG